MCLDVDTRPDISFEVILLAQYVENPTNQLWVFVKKVFRDISVTIEIGLTYYRNEPLFAIGYSNSDWGGCATTLK